MKLAKEVVEAIQVFEESLRVVKQEGRKASALFRGVVRLLKCRGFGHRYQMIEVPVQIEAEETFGTVPRYDEFRLTFENMIRVKRMIEPAPREIRCVRCYLPMAPRAVGVRKRKPAPVPPRPKT